MIWPIRYPYLYGHLELRHLRFVEMARKSAKDMSVIQARSHRAINIQILQCPQLMLWTAPPPARDYHESGCRLLQCMSPRFGPKRMCGPRQRMFGHISTQQKAIDLFQKPGPRWVVLQDYMIAPFQCDKTRPWNFG